MKKLQCIRCEKDLKNILEKGIQPVGGLAFHTHGHYGSAFFDPLDGTHIQIVVCDVCLSVANDRGQVSEPAGYDPAYDWGAFSAEYKQGVDI